MNENGNKLLLGQLLTWAHEFPKKEAIIDAQTSEHITYEELLFALFAYKKLFGKTRQKIILAAPGGIANSVVWLAVLLYGHYLIPINPDTTEFEFKQIIKHHKPTLLITGNSKLVKNANIKTISLKACDDIINESKKNRTTSLSEDTVTDGMVYLETSGSTGKPKGMTLQASQIVITANNIKNMHELTSEDRGFTPLPFYHVNAPIVSLISTMLAGGTVIIAPKFSASRFWKQIKKYNPTWISVVPTIVAILLKLDTPTFLKRSSIRFFRTASAPLPKINLLLFEKKFGLPLIETYGISEAASTIFMNPLPPKIHKPGSAGLPLLEAKIVNTKKGTNASMDEIGEIYIRGPQIIDHYEKNRSKKSFKDGWFITGDLGYFDKDGYLFLTGRKKEIIIRGGENIMPREIEEVLSTHPEVTDVAVVGKPDAILGEKVVAFVVVKNKNMKKITENIKELVISKLAPRKVPAEIFIINTLPRGKLNKIDKKTLKKMASTE